MSNLPTEHSHLVPYITVDPAAAAITFYVEAFGAVELYRLTDKDGRIGHAELDLGTGRLMLSDPYPDFGAQPPSAPAGVVFALYVADVDATSAAAVSRGATLITEPEDQFYGDRISRVRDPFGHMWALHQRLREVTPDEMKRLFEGMG